MNSQVIFKIDKKLKDKAMLRARRAGLPFSSVLKFATEAYADGRLNIGLSEPERFNASDAKGMNVYLDSLK